MEQTVYADLYFMINFSMDFLCFYLVSRLLGLAMSTARAALASALGGAYAVLALVLGATGAGGLLLDALVCALMCAVAFGKRGGIRRLLFYIAVYFAVSVTLGGFMTAIFNLLNRTSLGALSVSEDGVSAWLLAVIAAIGAVITLLGGRSLRRRASKRRVRLSVSVGQRHAELDALCDSGNMLREPISGKLCIIVSLSAMERILPPAVSCAISGASKEIDAPTCLKLGLRVVPTSTATGEGMLFALRPDSVSVDDGRESYSVDALLAFSSLHGFCDGTEALFPTELLI